MRKVINIITLISFLWLLLDALNVPNIILNFLLSFLLAGVVPGTYILLPPSTMMALFTTVALVIIFEMLARRYASVARVRQSIVSFTQRNWRYSVRRLGRA